ncbi:MAG: GNAT family N-acetyltransferase [Gemmobacter sp.]
MTASWLHPPQGPSAMLAQAVAATVPVFVTERLRLRAPSLNDYPAYEAVFTSDRARYMGGPFDADEAFADFCQGIAGWMLRGAGMWTVTLTGDDAAIGWMFLWQEMGDPEPEMGWILTEAAEGRGYATEAARAVMPHALQMFGRGGFVSYIDRANPASMAVATRLGARRDAVAETALADPDLVIYRHFGLPEGT